jgi:hypothetical protein
VAGSTGAGFTALVPNPSKATHAFSTGARGMCSPRSSSGSRAPVFQEVPLLPELPAATAAAAGQQQESQQEGFSLFKPSGWLSPRSWRAAHGHRHNVVQPIASPTALSPRSSSGDASRTAAAYLTSPRGVPNTAHNFEPSTAAAVHGVSPGSLRKGSPPSVRTQAANSTPTRSTVGAQPGQQPAQGCSARPPAGSPRASPINSSILGTPSNQRGVLSARPLGCQQPQQC